MLILKFYRVTVSLHDVKTLYNLERTFKQTRRFFTAKIWRHLSIKSQCFAWRVWNIRHTDREKNKTNHGTYITHLLLQLYMRLAIQMLLKLRPGAFPIVFWKAGSMASIVCCPLVEKALKEQQLHLVS